MLQEQLYKNTNRKYYHGSIKDYNDSLRKFKEFYLTPKLEYAFPYAGRGGFIETYVLKNTTNIFNMKCKSDEACFRTYCQRNDQNLLQYIEHMKDNDWVYIKGRHVDNKL